MTRLDNPRRRVTRPWRVEWFHRGGSGYWLHIATYSTEGAALDKAGRLIAGPWRGVAPLRVIDRTNPEHFTVLRPQEIA